jgi:elongation factor G
MMSYTTKDIRNICLAGHAGSGKTTLTESLLHTAGAIATKGSIERGSTVSDFDPQEKKAGHSLATSVCHLDHKDIHVNLIDTPGYPDFCERSVAIMPAVETAVIVINAQSGVEMVTQRVMDAAASLGLCRLIVINKIDEEEVDLAGLLDQIQTAYGSECLPLNLPVDGGKSVVDCFFKPSDQETDLSSVSDAHTQIIEQVVEVNEDLMEAYLEHGDDLDPAKVHDAFEQALREGHLIPVCFASAATGVGVPELLEIIERLMPNPLEANPPHFMSGEGESVEEVEVVPDPDAHSIAHVFKVSVDPYKGQLAMFRIHQGTVKTNSQLFVGDARKPFKVAHLLKVNGSEHTDVDKGVPGDICAVSKAEDIQYNSVLHDSHDEDNYHLVANQMPLPMYGLAITPARHGDEQKVSDVFSKLLAEDPCLQLEHVRSLNETVLKGMGELHLRAVLEKMRDHYNVEVDTRVPRIAYKETIKGKADGHHRHKKQTGGAGQFGEVFLSVEPLPRGRGFEFVDKVVGGAIPYQYIPAVEKGVQQVMASGAIAGFEMQDIRVTVYDGKHHSVDSKEIAFVQAGKKAFIEAVNKAKPIIMEPIVNMTVNAPASCMGDINGDISSMQGIINGTSALANGRVEITAQIPLSAISDYHSRLKSITEGEGTYSISFDHFAQVSGEEQQRMVKEFSPQND